jgi:hypothetical protein
MKTLYVVKDGLKDKGLIRRNGKQVKNTNFYLLTYGRNNEGKIEETQNNIWLLYTQIGEQKAKLKMKKDGIKYNIDIRYYYFSSFQECIEKLQELCGNTKIEICNSETYHLLFSSTNL